MKLSALNPKFLNVWGDSEITTRGAGVEFDCPCGCDDRCFIPFDVALDGKPYPDGKGWTRTGATFEDLTLTPSILRSSSYGGCGWHGFITNGEVRTV